MLLSNFHRTNGQNRSYPALVLPASPNKKNQHIDLISCFSVVLYKYRLFANKISLDKIKALS